MLNNKIASFICAIALVGCATQQDPTARIVTQLVEVPIPVMCKAEVPEKPVMNMDKVTVEDDIFVKVQALLADMNLHIGYEIQLLSALMSCK